MGEMPRRRRSRRNRFIAWAVPQLYDRPPPPSTSHAAACAARRLGLCGDDVAVHMPGGLLRVEIGDDYSVTQTGPATKVAEGQLALEALTADAAWPPR